MLINYINLQHWIILLWYILHLTWAERNSNTELTEITEKHKHKLNRNLNNLLDAQTNNQHSQLNSLNVYTNNYDVFTNGQRQYPAATAASDFKPSFKMPEMQNNFKPTKNLQMQNKQPIQMHSHNIQQIQPEKHYQISEPFEAAVPQPMLNVAIPAPLIQYMPQVNNEQGVQYMQLIAARPILLPISPVASNVASYMPTSPSALTNANNYIDYTGRPMSLVNSLPINGAPTQTAIAKSPVIDISLRPGTFGLFTYAGASTQYKPNFRINRDIKENLTPSPLTLNVNEYLPTMPTKMPAFLIHGRH